MTGYSLFYKGAGYGLDSKYQDPLINTKYQVTSSQIGMPTDPRTANQLDAVSKKISTGVKTIEVSGVSPEMWEAVPEHHLTEINRLKKLAGIDLTFHGPLVEPTGVSRQGWDESQRHQAERSMWSAVERSHKLDPKGNVVVTFHSSNGLPEPESIEYDKDGKAQVKQVWIVDERTGRFESVGPTKKDYFLEGTKSEIKTPQDEIEKHNKDGWQRALQHVNYGAYQGAQIVQKALYQPLVSNGKEVEKDENALLGFYKELGSEEGQQKMNLIKEKTPEIAIQLQERTRDLTHGDLFLRDSYNELQNLYNQAYDAATRAVKLGDSGERSQAEKDLEKLKAFKKEITPKIEYLDDPSHVNEFAEEIVQGVNVLRTIAPPRTMRPLKEFAIDKASETFANVAFNSYKEFKNTSPIISIENPPAGSGLSRADELKDLVEASRKKFAVKAQEELGLSASQAEEQAKRLIGVTWDVGHINMIRKHGAGEKEIISETKKIAPFVKHVHLSDNFGLEHTELPMGMGNVPTKQMLDLIGEYNKKAKKIVETGGPWYQFFQKSPLRETFEAFGSPVYSMKAGPSWNQSPSWNGDYFSGYGRALPDINFATYGAGFSSLPIELGGQVGGGRNRLSGAPME